MTCTAASKAIRVTEVIARDIPDAWVQCLNGVLKHGFKYKVEKGSFEREFRVELDWVTVVITHPYYEPYDNMLPKLSPLLGIPDPVAPDYVEQYLPYWMTEAKKLTEDYTYGSRLWPQVDSVVEMLKKTPGTNQAILQVAQPRDILLNDPPCLRHIDLRVKNSTLFFYPYFRSWDLWAGFPANLAAIAILQKYIADLIGVGVGSVISSSKGLHLYKYAWELAAKVCGLKASI